MPEGKFDIDPKDVDIVVDLVKQLAKDYHEETIIGKKVEIQERTKDKLNQGLKEMVMKIDESNAELKKVQTEIEEDPERNHLIKTIEGLQEKLSESDIKKFQEKMGKTPEEFADGFNTMQQDFLAEMKELGIGQVTFRNLLYKYSEEIKKVVPITIGKIAEAIKTLIKGNEEASKFIDGMKKIKKELIFKTPYTTIKEKASFEILNSVKLFAKYEWIRSFISRLKRGWVWLVNTAKKLNTNFENAMSHYDKANSLLQEVLREGTEEPLKPSSYKKESIWKKLKEAAEGKDIDEIKKGPGGHIPDATGPHGRGEGPGKGKGDGSGMEKKPTEEKDKIKVGITFDEEMYQLDFDKENAEIILKALKTPEEKIKEVLAEPEEKVSITLNLTKKKEKESKPVSEKKGKEEDLLPTKKPKKEFPDKKPIGEGKTPPIKEFKKDDIWDKLDKANKKRR